MPKFTKKQEKALELLVQISLKDFTGYFVDTLNHLKGNDILPSLANELTAALKDAFPKNNVSEVFLKEVEVLKDEIYHKLWFLSKFIKEEESSASVKKNVTSIRSLLEKISIPQNCFQFAEYYFHEADLVVYDVDGTLIGQKGYNESLIDAAIEENLKVGVMLTNMDLSDISNKLGNTLVKYIARYELEEYLKFKKMIFPLVITPGDPGYTKEKQDSDRGLEFELGAAYREVYRKLYEEIFPTSTDNPDSDVKQERREKITDAEDKEYILSSKNFKSWIEYTHDMMKDQAARYKVNQDLVKVFLLDALITQNLLLKSVFVCEDDLENAVGMAKLSSIYNEENKLAPKITVLIVDMSLPQQTKQFYVNSFRYHKSSENYLTEAEKLTLEKFYDLLSGAKEKLDTLKNKLAETNVDDSLNLFNKILQSLELLLSTNRENLIKTWNILKEKMKRVITDAETFRNKFSKSLDQPAVPFEILTRVLMETDEFYLSIENSSLKLVASLASVNSKEKERDNDEEKLSMEKGKSKLKIFGFGDFFRTKLSSPLSSNLTNQSSSSSSRSQQSPDNSREEKSHSLLFRKKTKSKATPPSDKKRLEFQ